MARDRGSRAAGERTEAERERAREERERRRLAKTGSNSPAPIEPPLPPPATEPAASRSVPPSAESAAARQSPQASPSEGSSTLTTESSAPLTPESSPFTLENSPLTPESPQASQRQARTPPSTSAPSTGAHRLHRPHLHRPHIPQRRGWAARVGASLALIIVLGALAIGVTLLVHHSERPKIPPPPAVVKVVIPEGYTRTQIAALAHADGLRGSYLVASKRSVALRPSRYGAPAGTPNLEGFLFPATYDMDTGASASRLVAEQLVAFRENFGGGEVHRAKLLGITPYELLIVASIIEREAAIAHDRPLVAAVIYNRLRQSMTLGVDSTLRYALHDFTHPLTEAELASNSPYNTRVHKGLPPTPISNPGVAAIKAAAHPANVSYLYYVAGADGCGEQVFSTSYTQFEKDAAAYRDALSKNGGRVPTCKKK